MLTEKLLQLRIVSVNQESPVCKTYQLELLNRANLIFKPGQFLTFIIRTEKQELRRSYSILSLPGEPLKITVKKVDNGLISRYILQNWQEGELIRALPPAGWFTLEPQKKVNRDIFCFAAGSGIIPILPQIRMLIVKEPQSIIHLIYSNHNEQDALFLSEIESLAGRYAALNLIPLFSDPLRRKADQGRLSNLSTELLVRKILKYDKQDAVFLLCGPFAYMRMLNFTIGLMHFRKENIRRENFLPQVIYTSEASHPMFPGRNVSLEIYGKAYTLNVSSGQNILDAALRDGIDLPYSCKGGVCGTCACICRSGKVFMSINEVLSDNDLVQGWVLTCTGYPEADNTSLIFNG